MRNHLARTGGPRGHGPGTRPGKNAQRRAVPCSTARHTTMRALDVAVRTGETPHAARHAAQHAMLAPRYARAHSKAHCAGQARRTLARHAGPAAPHCAMAMHPLYIGVADGMIYRARMDAPVLKMAASAFQRCAAYAQPTSARTECTHACAPSIHAKSGAAPRHAGMCPCTSPCAVCVDPYTCLQTCLRTCLFSPGNALHAGGSYGGRSPPATVGMCTDKCIDTWIGLVEHFGCTRTRA